MSDTRRVSIAHSCYQFACKRMVSAAESACTRAIFCQRARGRPRVAVRGNRRLSLASLLAPHLGLGSQLLFNRSRFRFSARCTVRVRHVANRHPRSLIVRTPFACRVPHRRNPHITQWPGSSEREREGEERRACYANLGK